MPPTTPPTPPLTPPSNQPEVPRQPAAPAVVNDVVPSTPIVMPIDEKKKVAGDIKMADTKLSSGYSFRFSDIFLFILGAVLGLGINILGGSITLGIVQSPSINMILLTALNILLVRVTFKSRGSVSIGVGLIVFYIVFLFTFGSCFFMTQTPTI